VIEKDQGVQDKLRELLMQSFMFKYLNKEESQTVIMAMEGEDKKAGDLVI
jgi:hypothetical protein